MVLAERLSQTSPRHWILSVIGHAIVIGLLLWVAPHYHLVPSATGHKDTFSQLAAADPQRREEIIRSIGEQQAARAKAEVSRMLEEEKRIDDLVKTRLDALKQEMAQITAAAPPAALDQLKAAAQAQANAGQDQQKLAQTLQDLMAKINAARAAHDPATLQKAAADLAPLRNELAAAEDEVKKQQLAAQTGQDKATDLLKFVASTYPDSVNAQAAADANQQAAAASQRRASDRIQANLHNLDQFLATAAHLQATPDEVTPTQAALATAQQQQLQQQQASDAAKARVQAADQALQNARNLAGQTHAPADQAAAQTAQAASDAAHRDLDSALRAFSMSQQVASAAQNHLNDVQNRANGNLINATNNLAGIDLGQLINTHQQALQDQANAARVQADAIAKLTGAMAQHAAAPANPANNDLGAPPTPPAPDASSLDGKNLAQLFDAAKTTENRIAEKYKTFRAAELASIQKSSLSEALSETEVAQPQRDDFDTALLASTGANTDLAAYKAAVIKASRQLGGMAALTSNMLAKMEEQQEQSGSGTIDVSNWLKGQSDSYEMQKTLATDNDDNIAGKDLTALMKGPRGAGGIDVVGDPSQPGYLHAYPRNAPELPAMDYAHLKPLATRRITADGQVHNDWIYIDSWYLIGPFPNEGRRNLYTHFPPESIIDLNASYIGKYGKPIHWVYRQWPDPQIRIPHDFEEAPAIYYAYTEIYLDQPRDLWITTGSDDKGTIWLNNTLIWNSGDEFKSWEANEGYRKVHFEQGLNKVLYRLENGQLAAALSFMISLKPGN